MTIGALDFLNFANDYNAKADKSETDRRVIIGRAYYALFHAASELAVSDFGIELDDLNRSTHSRLFQGLKDHATSNHSLRCKLQSLSRDLKRLHSVRVRADYILNQTVTQPQVDTMLEDAGWISRRILELQSDSATV